MKPDRDRSRAGMTSSTEKRSGLFPVTPSACQEIAEALVCCRTARAHDVPWPAVLIEPMINEVFCDGFMFDTLPYEN